jgi:hypothetical protein
MKREKCNLVWMFEEQFLLPVGFQKAMTQAEVEDIETQHACECHWPLKPLRELGSILEKLYSDINMESQPGDKVSNPIQKPHDQGPP